MPRNYFWNDTNSCPPAKKSCIWVNLYLTCMAQKYNKFYRSDYFALMWFSLSKIWLSLWPSLLGSVDSRKMAAVRLVEFLLCDFKIEYPPFGYRCRSEINADLRRFSSLSIMGSSLAHFAVLGFCENVTFVRNVGLDHPTLIMLLWPVHSLRICLSMFLLWWAFCPLH